MFEKKFRIIFNRSVQINTNIVNIWSIVDLILKNYWVIEKKIGSSDAFCLDRIKNFVTIVTIPVS